MNVKALASACCPPFLRPTFERIERSPIGYRLAKGVFWSTAGAVISRGLMLAASIWVARMLGKETFGELGMVRSTVAMFGVFAGFGFGMTASKYVAEFAASDPRRAGRIMGISGLFAVVTGGLVAAALIVFAPWLAEHSMNAPHLAGGLRIAAVILFLSALNGAQNGALVGFEAFRTIAKVNLWGGLASFPLLVASAHFGGLNGAIWGLALSTGVLWLLSHLALRAEAARWRIAFGFRGCLGEWPILWRFSLPAAMCGIMVGPVFWVCNALLVNQPDGYGQMGVFSAADQWRLAILFVPATMSQVVLPMLSSLQGQNRRAAYLKVLKSNVLVNGGAALVMAALISLTAPWIMGSYGEGFEQGSWVLACLSLTAVLIAVNNVVGQAIVSQGRMWAGFWLNACWAVAMIASARIFTVDLRCGALGLAMAYCVSYLCHTGWTGCYAWRLLRNGRPS
ncbi:MAG: oligosaccharide flippase family protein [Planctomycetia bacterium]|nr:oligosaccharide flippase family protein [Planctomycetia bacterium]